MLFDLSHKIRRHMPVYPGDRMVDLSPDRTVSRDGYSLFRLSSNLHLGTHLDAPSHFFEDQSDISGLPVGQCCGKGRVFDARGESVLSLKAGYDAVSPGEAVLFYTGCDAIFESDAYFASHPVMSVELASFLVRRSIRMVGFDLPSPDGEGSEIHRIFLSAGIPILENLTGLEALLTLPSFFLFAFPLKIEAEGSPVRAVAAANLSFAAQDNIEMKS